MAQKITIPIGFSFDDKDKIKELGKDLANAISGSGVKDATKKTAKDLKKSLEEAADEIGKIQEKGFIDTKDISSLNNYISTMEKNLKELQNLSQGIFAAPVKEVEELDSALKELETKQKERQTYFENIFKASAKTAKLTGVNPKNAEATITSWKSQVSTNTANMAGQTPEEVARLTDENVKLEKQIANLERIFKLYNRQVGNSSSYYERQKVAATNAANAAQGIANDALVNDVEVLNTKIQNSTTHFDDYRSKVADAGSELLALTVKNETIGNALEGMKNKLMQVTSAIFLLRKGFQTLKKAATTVAELDKEMTEIAIVSKKTTQEMWGTFDQFNRLAYDLNTTTKQYLEGAKIFYQQGYNMAQVISMVDATTKAAALSSVSFAEASETLTAAIRAFNLEASQALSITDKYAAVGAYSAADFHELSVAMEKVASSAYTAGMSFDATLGILAKGIETTKEAPEAIGTALKTIIARFQEMKTDPMADLGEGVDANRVEKALKTVGVSLRDANGEFRDLDGVFDDLGAKWEGLTRNQKAYIATMAAGSRQQSRFMAIMNNYDRTLQLVRMSTNSAGEANRQYQIYGDSVEAANNRMKNSLEALYTTIIKSDTLKNFYDGLSIIINLITELNPLLVAAGVIVAALTFKTVALTSATKIAQMGAIVQVDQLPVLIKWIGKKIAKTTSDTATTLTQAAAQKTLNLATLGYIAAAAAVVIGIIALVRWAEKRRNQIHQEAIELAKQAESEKQSANNLETQILRYEELSKIINKTAAEKAEYKEITDSIAKEAPNLVAGIDAEGNAILARNEELEKELQLRKDIAAEKAKEAYSAKSESMFYSQWNAESVEEGAIGQASIAQAEIVEKLKSSGEGGTVLTDAQIQEMMGMSKQERASVLAKEQANAMISLDYGQEQDPVKRQKALDDLTSYYDELEKQINRLVDIRGVESKNIHATNLFGITENELDQLDREGEKISETYRSFIGQMSYDVTGYLEEEARKKGDDPVLYLNSQAEKIQKNWFDKMESMRKMSGFDEALQEIMDAKKAGKSFNEIETLVDDFGKKFGMSGDQFNVFKESNLGQKDFDKMINTITGYFDNTEVQFDPFGNIIESSVVGYDYSKLYKQFSLGFSNFLSAGIENIDDDSLQKDYINKLPEIFNSPEVIAEMEDAYANWDKTSIISTQNFEKTMGDILLKSGMTAAEVAEIVNATIVSEIESAKSYLDTAKKAYEELNKINELQKKSATVGLTTGEAFSAVESKQTLQNIGDSFFVSGSSIEAMRMAEENKMADQLSEALAKLTEEKEQAISAKQDDSVIQELQREIDGYQKIYDNVIKVTRAERDRINNQDVMSGVSAINASVNSLKDYADVYQKLNDGGMSYLDTVEALGNNPELFGALEATNGQFEFTKEKIEEITRAKKEETLTFLTSERDKLQAVSDLIDYELTGNIERTKSNFKLATDTLKGYDAENEAAGLVADQEAEITKTFLANKQKEIDAEYQLYLQTMQTIQAQEAYQGMAITPIRGKQIIDQEVASSSDKSQVGMAETLAAKFKLTSKDNDEILRQSKAIIDEEIKKLNGQIAGYENISLGAMLGLGEDESEEASEGFDKVLGQFDQYYNLLKKIASLEEEMSQLDTRIGLESTGGAEDIALLKEKMTLLHQQAKVTGVLVDRQEQALALARDDMSKFGSFVSFAEDELVVRWDLINAIEITSETQQIWYDELLASIDAYDEQKDALDENIQKLLDYQAAVEEATKTLTDEVVDARQEIYDALVEADKKEVDELKEKYDKMSELENNYVNAVKKAIDKERQLRDSSRKQQDLETKKRKLAVYERDTSGVYSQQAEKLRAEIANDEQSMRDEAVDKQLERLEEQINLAKEQRDMQIKRMQDFISFKQENGVYWQQVDSKIAEGAASVNSLLLSTQAFHTDDPLKQQEMMVQAQNTSTKLQTILDSGGAIAGGNVVQTLKNGITSTVNGKVGITHDVANYETQSLSAVKSAGDEARLAKLELQTANKKLDSSNSKLDALVAKPVAGASSTYIDNSSRSTTNYVPVLNVASQTPNSGTWVWSETIGSTGGWYNSVTGQYKYMPYAEGGVVDYTGPAMVHGSEQRPEAFLSADQTALFAGLRDVLEGINMNNLPLQKDSSSATNIGDININLANRPSASAQDIGAEVKKALVDVLSGRNTPAITRVRQ